MAEKQVIINGRTFLYKQKAPFVASGMSVLGAIEYDAEEDKIRCHECGEWFEGLQTHVWRQHGLSAREYKLKHGLTLGAALVNERVRIIHSEHGRRRGTLVEKQQQATMARAAIRNFGKPCVLKTELRNERGRCAAQLLAAIRNLAAKLGHTPSRKELRSSGMSHSSILHALSLPNMAAAMSLAGLQPRKKGRRYSDDILVEMLRDFYARSGKLPSTTDFRRRSLPNKATFVNYFGSWRTACEAAGLGKVRRQEVA